MPCRKPINEAHLAEPGLAVVEVEAADDQTALPSRSCSPRGVRSRRRTERPGYLGRRRLHRPPHHVGKGEAPAHLAALARAQKTPGLP
ncbi:DUF6207 family protein [Streptomyces coeruleorubidus]|uniref:DUF6207 family protein n=1 Tax=Streptomyces coeruleorubidus TaxID=116188 RepID=UPI0037F50209